MTDRIRVSPDARTPRDQVLGLATWLEGAINAGVDVIQLRERDLAGRLLGDLVGAVRGCARGSGTRVVTNDRLDVAAASGSDGLHLRGDGPDIARVRTIGPAGWLVGRSVHSLEEAHTHAAADYLLFGSVFPSGNKPGRGLDALRGVTDVAVPPVWAVGGLTVARARACVDVGASGVAAIGLFLPPGRAPGALGIIEAVRGLRGAIDPTLTGHLQ